MLSTTIKTQRDLKTSEKIREAWSLSNHIREMCEPRLQSNIGRTD